MQEQSSNQRTLRGDEIPGGERSVKRRGMTPPGGDREDDHREPPMRRRKAKMSSKPGLGVALGQSLGGTCVRPER